MKLILLLLSSLKFGKLLTTGGTMIVSVVMYAFVYGWKYAVGFVGLIFVHEMGHYLAAKQKGLDVGVPVFIPFVGAWIALKEMPHDAEMEAYIGLGGPLVGSIGALACYFAAREYNSMLLLAISYSGFFLNLFNLIPVPPLDGGRITAVLSPRLWLLGLPILVAVFFYHPNPMLILIAVLAIPQVWRYFKNKEENPEEQAYYDVPLETKLMYGTYYLVLLIFLAMMVDGVHQLLPVR
jgi:Zn-dependent protease